MDRDAALPSRQLALRFWREDLAPHAPKMGAALALMMLEGSTLAILSWMLKPLFDRVFAAGDTGALWWVGAVIFGLFALRATTLVLSRWLMTMVSTAVAARLQVRMLSHVLTLDPAFFAANPPGALIERIQGDSAAVQGVWQVLVMGAGRDLVALVALFGVAIAIDPWWTLAALVGAPLLILPAVVVQRVIRRRTAQMRAAASERATRLDEIFHGHQAVRLNRLEAAQTARFAALVDRIRRVQVRTDVTASVTPAMTDIVTGIGFLGVLALGGAQVASGARSVGDFMAFFSALSLAFQPLRRLGMVAGAWQTAAASLQRIHALLDLAPAIRSGARTTPPGDTAIRFEGVHLDYGAGPVLRGLSFTAEAGRTTALVGPSGAGKTTVFQLLTRGVDPQAGRITLGGVDVAAFDLGTLRDQFAVVAQETGLFDETLAENLTLGRAVAAGRLDAAVAAAQLAEFVASLPEGLATPAGPRGSRLSGGQRQRVAIARALLRDAPVWLLDEATSALDAASETAVQAALEAEGAGRTVLVIAHRLATVRGADRIVVLEEGQAVETGTHAELIARGGAYAALVRLQMLEDA